MPVRGGEQARRGGGERATAAVGADGQPISPPGRRIIGVRPPPAEAPAPTLTFRQKQSSAAEFEGRRAADAAAAPPRLQGAGEPPVGHGVPGREVLEPGAEFAVGVAPGPVRPVGSTVPSCAEAMSGVPSAQRERTRGAPWAWAAFPAGRAPRSGEPRTAMWLSGSFSYTRTYPPWPSAATLDARPSGYRGVIRPTTSGCSFSHAATAASS